MKTTPARRSTASTTLGVIALTAGLSAGILGAVGVAISAGAADAGQVTTSPLVRQTPTDTATGANAPAAPRPGSLEALRAQVRQVPGDWLSWSALGGLELERGRATGDPSAYAAAQTAFDTSLRLQPEGNADALAGQGALAAARHDFADAERRSRSALAVDPDDPQGMAVLTDALTELGRYDEAEVAAKDLDAHRPGIASFSRLSYQAELRGRTDEAVTLMSRAAEQARTPAQVGFARGHEGLLRVAVGDSGGAQAAWQAGSAVAPDDETILRLGARLAWARGDHDEAVTRYDALVVRRPTTANAAAQAEVLAALGRHREARTALDVARAGQLLAREAGIEAEPVEVLFAADHGDAGQAVELAAGLWRRAPSVEAADAYAWALHVAGRDREALTFADRALGLGGQPALWLAHRGEIRAELGDRAGAAVDLRAALSIDPTFSALHAPRAVALLDRLEQLDRLDRLEVRS